MTRINLWQRNGPDFTKRNNYYAKFGPRKRKSIIAVGGGFHQGVAVLPEDMVFGDEEVTLFGAEGPPFRGTLYFGVRDCSTAIRIYF